MFFASMSNVGFLIMWIVSIPAFAVDVWAFVDALTRPTVGYTGAGKLTKNKWLLILGIGGIFGLLAVLGVITIIQILPVVGFIAACVYLADVRPAVRPYKGAGRPGSSSGPYGPW